ncbi:MAG: hypothetical protein U1F23_02140 [Lysobacterales bacterium]
MTIVTRLIALTRAAQLRRQFRDIGRSVQELGPVERRQLATIAMREFANAAQSEFPHLYGTPPEEKYHAWGSGTDIGLERAHSDSAQVRLRGVALWLAVAYHETKDSPYPEHQELHRQVMRTLRALRETMPPSSEGLPTGLGDAQAA